MMRGTQSPCLRLSAFGAGAKWPLVNGDRYCP